MSSRLEIDPLTRLSIRHGTDKWGPHFYTPIYHALFAHLREQPIRLLEIGVGGYEFRSVGGASLAMWAEYFRQGKIVGIDIAEKSLALDPRVTIVRGSQTDGPFLLKVVADHGPFDIIIDDGSHVPQHVVASFRTLFAGLVDGGFYVVEDVQTAFWPNYGGTAVTGGETLQLAQAILQALNYREICAAAPDWEVPAMAPAVRSFRAYHNLFIVEKGDNSEPSNACYHADNPHVARAVAAIERELTQSPTPAGNARLASVYHMVGRSQEARETVQQALANWPDNVSLLTAAADLAGRAGEKAAQLRYLERAVVMEPHDNALRQMLELAQASRATRAS
jgi:hypothetical protein